MAAGAAADQQLLNMDKDKRPVYIICPRCELNYIDSKEKHCQICKAEMGLVDPGILIKDEEDEEFEGRLCPVCNTNYCEEGEDICIVCRKERASREKIVEPDLWEEDDVVEPADIDDDRIEVSLTQLEEEEEDEHIDDDVLVHVDDFEYINPDEVEDLDEEDEEEDFDLDTDD